MYELAVISIVFAVALLFGVWLLIRGTQEPPAQVVPVQPVSPPVMEPKAAAPALTPRPAPQLRVCLVSAKGRALGEVRIDARQRRPVLRHRTKDELLSVFVADRQRDDGVWEYRRVGVEREH